MSKKRVWIVLGVAIVALFAVFKSFEKKMASSPASGSESRAFSEDGQSVQITSTKFGDEPLPPIGFLEGMFEKYSFSRILSDRTKESFSKQAHLQMVFPDYYRFHDLDMEFDNITGIYSTTPTMNVAVLAGKVLPTDEEVKAFLKAPDNGIPNTDGKEVHLIGEPIVVAAHEGSGLKAGKYWAGRTSDGGSVRVGFIQREDGLGSYLFIFTGQEDKLDNSEDFFEELYKNLKAQPE
jgi:hypothetical protein